MKVTMRAFEPDDIERCLDILDANTPDYFAPEERADYAAYLERVGAAYIVCVARGEIVGGFAVTRGMPGSAHLNWILVDPAAQGAGVGRTIMRDVMRRAAVLGVGEIDIAASHRSAPFFAHFGASEIARIENGWGPDMHRVDMKLTVRLR